MRTSTLRYTAAIFSFFCFTLSQAQTLSPDVQSFVKIKGPLVALAHVRVIERSGGAARQKQTVLNHKDKIQAIGDAASVPVPKDAQVFDLNGYSVIPGLVGMHEHMFYPTF